MFPCRRRDPFSGREVTTSERYEWWASLKHGGLMISPSKLQVYFPEDAGPLPNYLSEHLRRDLTRLEAGTGEAERSLLETVLVEFCGLDGQNGSRWERGSEVKGEWSRRSLTGEVVKPRWLWHGPNAAHFPVFVDAKVPRIGIGRGRRAVSRVVEWLRGGDQKIGLLTNLRQWRLVFAGLDFDAWTEWDTSLWLDGRAVSPQITALRVLLSRDALTPEKEGEPGRLLAAVQASRKGQAELSSELGERVRQAVELLIQEYGSDLVTLIKDGKASFRDIYIAATRIIMRMVIVLFTEARDLLPRDNAIYHGSYSLQGLRESLERVGGGASHSRLRHRFGGWPRVLALFRLVHDGSYHPDLPVPRYGGDLFAQGDSHGPDPISRVLSVFEGTEHAPSDAAVFQILNYLCRSRVKVRQGRASIWVEAPVDFSDLSSEYIGILYEGLLSYELWRVEDNDPVIFLALGDEPALPLSRLEAMDDKAVASLVEKAKKKSTLTSSGDEDGGEEEEGEEDGEELEAEGAEEEGDEETGAEAVGPPTEVVTDTEDDVRQKARERALKWAKRAVVAGKLVGKPRSKNAEALHAQERAVEEVAKSLIKKTVLPGEWFLVRFGGTRKGTGTFYTRPQLAVPTVHRTLRPLVYDPPNDKDGNPNEDAPHIEWTPKKPEEILALKVCDPACGSGSFLVASLRFLTNALLESLHHHGRIQSQGENTLVTLAEGKPGTGKLSEELLPRPIDAEDFEDKLLARLKRYVVELCIYGVDIDPLAVDLGRLALWVETMDRLLPFSFLDHKVKCGNALVGCWFDRFRDYPALAWEREGGDKTHTHGVHFKKEAWTKAIKKFRNKKVKPALATWIAGQTNLFERVEGRTPEEIHDEALALFEQMHSLPIHESEERTEFYRDKLQGNQALKRLREAFDTWCALWFWPVEKLDVAPLPQNLTEPSNEVRAIVKNLGEAYRFFHWELEFPDVFAKARGGFDAVVGNPPWENLQANPREFFSNRDPLFRAYGRLESLDEMERLFREVNGLERDWLSYCAHFKAYANWSRNVYSPFGDGTEGGSAFKFGRGGNQLHSLWRERRLKQVGFSDPVHPFRYQGGGRIFTYKLYLEASHALVRGEGHIGFLVPSSVYTDKGSTGLRQLFITRCRWRWLFGFENREKVFDIDSRFKFCAVILQKGGSTEAIQTAFMRRNLNDWEEAERHVIPYKREQIERFSPKTRAILEIRAPRDLEILEKIYSNSVLLGNETEDGWKIKYALEFMMNTDAYLFPPRPKWEAKGYKPDQYGRWIGPDGDIALPLYEGRMIGQFDFSEKGWVSGKGRGAVWRKIPWEEKLVEPEFLMRCAHLDELQLEPSWKVGQMRVTSATNTRTLISTFLSRVPCGDKVATLRLPTLAHTLALTCILNSFTFDYTARARVGGLQVDQHILYPSPVPMPDKVLRLENFSLLGVSLLIPSTSFAPEWLCLRTQPVQFDRERRAWKRYWALTPHERLRLRSFVDAVVAELYGLEGQDLVWVLRDCDHPVGWVRNKSYARNLDPKGFWRVDKDKDPELRHTVLTLAAFRDLKETIAQHGGDRGRGLEAFCNMNDGDGWQLPETLCLADLGLGHDDRAKKPQPVRSRLGERFLPWQLDQSVEESWAECEMHARNILGEEGFARLKAELAGDRASRLSAEPSGAEGSESYSKAGGQGKLF